MNQGVDMAVSLLVRVQPWFWMLLPTIAVIAWLLEQQTKGLQYLIGALVDQVAETRGMVRLDLPATSTGKPASTQ